MRVKQKERKSGREKEREESIKYVYKRKKVKKDMYLKNYMVLLLSKNSNFKGCRSY